MSLFRAEKVRVLSIASCLYYARQSSKSQYASKERHGLKSSVSNNTFMSSFGGVDHEVVIEPVDGRYMVSVDGADAVSYPKPNLVDAVIHMNDDIIQPLKITNQNVKIQFEGTNFDIPLMPTKAFNAERLMPEKPKEVRYDQTSNFSLLLNFLRASKFRHIFGRTKNLGGKFL